MTNHDSLKLDSAIADRLRSIAKELAATANNVKTGTIEFDVLIDLAAHIQENLIQRGQWVPDNSAIKVNLFYGANAYALIEHGSARTDIRLSPGKGAPASLREYAQEQRQRAKQILGLADLAERAANVYGGSSDE